MDLERMALMRQAVCSKVVGFRWVDVRKMMKLDRGIDFNRWRRGVDMCSFTVKTRKGQVK